jgi:hypothetical protein
MIYIKIQRGQSNMKSIIRKVSVSLIGLVISSSLLSAGALAKETGCLRFRPDSSANAVMTVETDKAIVPYADIIDWRYKLVDGKLYKRLYNYSKQEWIGEWEPC